MHSLDNLKTHKTRIFEDAVVNLLHSDIDQIAIEVKIKITELDPSQFNADQLSTKPINFSGISYLNSMRVNYLKW